MKITINKKEWAGNVVYCITVSNPTDTFLKMAQDFITSDHRAQSFMPRIVKCEHLVTKCDHSNPFNPSEFVVLKNSEFIQGVNEVAK
jgi:hypothetical protein